MSTRVLVHIMLQALSIRNAEHVSCLQATNCIFCSITLRLPSSYSTIRPDSKLVWAQTEVSRYWLKIRTWCSVNVLASVVTYFHTTEYEFLINNCHNGMRASINYWNENDALNWEMDAYEICMHLLASWLNSLLLGQAMYAFRSNVTLTRRLQIYRYLVSFCDIAIFVHMKYNLARVIRL